MKILLTGATGYIGKRLLPILLSRGHEVVCCVRDRNRFPTDGIYAHDRISLLEVDFLKPLPSSEIIKDIDAAYYLIHSMSAGTGDFAEMEAASAHNFLKLVEPTSVKQIIYLTGITNEEELSKHLSSRQNVEEILGKSSVPLTALKAGIIVGSGSASFEIMRDLVEKLPVMITPKWVTTKSQPIAIRNVLEYLEGVLLREDTFNRAFDIGGPDVLTYKEMMLQFADVRGFKRKIITVPVMTPRLSSYWLYFVTSTSYKLAINLVDSMKVEVIAKDNDLEKMLGIKSIPYKEAVALAFQKIEQNSVISSWKDSLASSYSDNSLLEHINVPTDGCFKDYREKKITGDPDTVLKNIWAIGGKRGWYYGSRLWKIRGFMDKMVGGVGLRRGRTHPYHINTGDTLDFWRVLAADEKNRRLLLYAEMKLPGEAWLEFKITERNGEHFLQQTATFRPHGLAGRLYWYTVLPFHFFVFEGMAGNLVKFIDKDLEEKTKYPEQNL
ncbi:SDR family oxidoreductase [Salinimicrobium sp. MT39]|uniref:SDR family oxidoreductase n=1 Tax=Salinimicrobium profundisediminis TaxID=2994553 RepID=A0A9X3I250_9FLAO|nr:SDR family oxidoreductase [Salinimicrobium profundisediminis]MCX2839269.1 SDR family oxidoreductase [Salinimicrobium profundisediminis]